MVNIFEWDQKTKGLAGEEEHPVPTGHVRVNPDTFPHQTRPIEQVADWCNDAARVVRTHLAKLTFNARRLDYMVQWLEKWTQDPAPETTKEDVNEAVERRDYYWHWAKSHGRTCIEQEWVGSRHWMLLTPEMRRDQGCDTLWEVDAGAEDVMGATWKMKAATLLPEGFEISELMGYQWGPWSDWLRMYGTQEYCRRGWLRHAPDIRKAQKAADRRSAIAGITRDQLYGKRNP